jgi:hypothetical protein
MKNCGEYVSSDGGSGRGGEYAGDVREYAGDVREYAGDVGEYGTLLSS